MASEQIHHVQATAHVAAKQQEQHHSIWLLQALHLLSAMAVIFGLLILPSLLGFHLITHPLQTIRCALAIVLPITLLAHSFLHLHKGIRSVWLAIGYGVLSIPIGAIMVTFLAIACGAPIAIEYASRTLHWSIFMSTLSIVPAVMVLGTSWPDWHRIFARTRPKKDLELLICIPAHGALIGAWFGAWVMPLDWDRPWQVWPISCTYGAVGGYLCGLVMSSISRYLQCFFNQLKMD